MMLHKALFTALLSVLCLTFGPATAAPVTSEPLVYTLGGPVATGLDVNFNTYQADPYTLYDVLRIKDKANVKVGSLELDNAAILDRTVSKSWYPNAWSYTYYSEKPEGLNSADNYLAVYGCNPCSEAGSATFTLNKGVNYNTFSFLWGSMDSYNTLTVIDRNGKSQTLYGSDLIAANASLAGSTKYFSVTDMDGIAQIILSSTTNAFEIARATFSNVPLPAALPMFGMALAGMALVRKRRSKLAA